MNKWSRPFEWNRASAEPAGSGPATFAHHYFAFLSYSHRDTADADWLHGELERFRIPSSLAGKLTGNGVIPKQLTPIFRDRHELAAGHDLSADIRLALAASRCLIVLCSPAAAQSQWTNAEIGLFKREHPDGCIIAAIVAGEPFASEIPGRSSEECFPPSLRRKYDRRGRPTDKRAEPLAADLRPNADGRRLGLLKIVAGILGLGLDDLVQREHLRRQRRLALISAGSIAGMVIASGLALTAIEARNSARDQRRQAESLVGFMLGDLKDKLEPLGRLDVLDSVAAKALAYYRSQDPSTLSDESLAQRSRALTLMGQVASTRGDLDSAIGFYRAAFAGSAEALRRSPDDPQRLFDHAQNVFYMGDIAHTRGNLSQSVAAMREYKRLATRLVATDPSNPKWQMEGIYADTNLGIMLYEEGRYASAAAVFSNALSDRETLVSQYPANEQFRNALVEILAWLGDARENQGRIQDGLAQRERQIALLQPILANPTSSADYKRQAVVAYRSAGRLQGTLGNVQQGIERLRTSIAIGDRLIASDSDNSAWAAATNWAKFDLARLELATGSLDEAAALIQSACDSTDRLIARDPTAVTWRYGLRIECLEASARLALERGSAAEAKGYGDQMLDTANAESAHSKSPDSRLDVVKALLVQAVVDRTGGDRVEAARALAGAGRSWPRGDNEKPGALADKVLILTGLGKVSDADSIARQLDSMGYKEPLYLHDRALFSND